MAAPPLLFSAAAGVVARLSQRAAERHICDAQLLACAPVRCRAVRSVTLRCTQVTPVFACAQGSDELTVAHALRVAAPPGAALLPLAGALAADARTGGCACDAAAGMRALIRPRCASTCTNTLRAPRFCALKAPCLRGAAAERSRRPSRAACRPPGAARARRRRVAIRAARLAAAAA
jgi:hypothetical protein